MPARRDLVQRLLRVERRTALLFYCQPTNAASEQARIHALWRSGRPEAPRFCYRPAPELHALRDELSRLERTLAPRDPIAHLYVERIHELVLETELVEAVSTPRFAALCAKRFPAESDAVALSAARTAERWAKLVPEASLAATVMSDDPRHPESLLNHMRRTLSQHQLEFRLELRPMAPAAATGERVVYVAPGRWLTPSDASRIVEHEVFGHALPQQRAGRQSVGLFAAGSARGTDAQEGYALYRERLAGFLDDRRKRELGLRHLAALSVRNGADWVETTRLLLTLSASLDEAVALSSRVHRGGGLARELVYLVALERVENAAGEDPSCLDWLGRGRLSLEAIRALRSAQSREPGARPRPPIPVSRF